MNHEASIARGSPPATAPNEPAFSPRHRKELWGQGKPLLGLAQTPPPPSPGHSYTDRPAPFSAPVPAMRDSRETPPVGPAASCPVPPVSFPQGHSGLNIFLSPLPLPPCAFLKKEGSREGNREAESANPHLPSAGGQSSEREPRAKPPPGTCPTVGTLGHSERC